MRVQHRTEIIADTYPFSPALLRLSSVIAHVLGVRLLGSSVGSIGSLIASSLRPSGKTRVSNSARGSSTS
jgi:hypothetical protein